MEVVINLINPDENRTHYEVSRAYIDGIFFCVDEPDGLYKYKMDNIWLVVERQITEEKEDVSE